MAKSSVVRTQAARTPPARNAERARDRGVAATAASLDRLIHERMRLAIVAELAAAPSRSFSELKRHLKTTDGNLSVHARRLEDAGYILGRKRMEGRQPRTEYSLTPAGRAALTRYLDQIDALVAALRRG